MPDRHPSHPILAFIAIAAAVALAAVPPALATDIDGPDDCQRDAHDYGDAPESVLAYPGVPGAFPTCIAPGPVGTRTLATAPISTPPGPAGYVHHVVMPQQPPFWLGCSLLGGPLGLDGEIDGKTNAAGMPTSACQPLQSVDCFENAFGLVFGQDDCYGGTDAAIASSLTFGICQYASFAFTANNCAPVDREVYLNVCLDMDQDGDWNDNFLCPSGQYAFEWVLKNVPIVLPPGCTLRQTPSFLVGPNVGQAWMRVTLTEAPVFDDFPWNGSASMPGESFVNGETEDYPVMLRAGLCPEYSDFGDAPDDFLTYGGTVVGNFPTCIFAGLVGTQTVACPPISTAPQSTGYVEHRASILGTQLVWLGCTPSSVDSEPDGKTNLTGGGVPSICNQAVTTDCTESMPWGTPMGQDECYGDLDACLTTPVTFETCQPETLTFSLYNCGSQVATVHLNLLVDWNQDGDWNDNFLCAGGVCVYEWAIKNQSVLVPPGCSSHTFILPYAGPFVGDGWMRVTVSDQAVSDDFPWAGSATLQPAYLAGGETEDYPVSIVAPQECSPAYVDFGDAPEGYPAYPGGAPAQFPTCAVPYGPLATWEDYCATPTSAPALTPTGVVQHVAAAGDAFAFWLGCGTTGKPQAGRDGEIDGRTNPFSGLTASFCNPAETIDCVETAFGMQFGQDECYGDGDAGLASTVLLQTCVPNTVSFQAYSCAQLLQSVYLNILVDMNQDGDWVDRASCPGTPPASCPWEWAVQNALVTLPPGCATVTSPPFLVGARDGMSWMRITLSEQPAPADFAWNGTASLPGGAFARGETEDYPLEIAAGPVEVGRVTPSRTSLAPLTPNPARSWTTARFALSATETIELAAYDVGGRRVRALFAGEMSAGEHAVRWDLTDEVGRPVPAGIYLIRLRVGTETFVRRAIRID
jgi:hypothetical protein